MHARELIEMAASVASHTQLVLRDGFQMPDAGIQRYWAASKCRHQSWARSIKNVGTPIRTQPSRSHRPLWIRLRPLAEEVLTGEVLTRVWAGVCGLYDQRNATTEAEPIARSVLIGHLEARYRVLSLVIQGQQHEVPEAIELNKLRLAAERWSDILLGYLANDYDVCHLAFDAPRVSQFAKELEDNGTDEQTWKAVLDSVRACSHLKLDATSPNASLNWRIATGVLCCFHPELLDAAEPARMPWVHRMHLTASDTQDLIEELLGLDAQSGNFG